MMNAPSAASQRADAPLAGLHVATGSRMFIPPRVLAVLVLPLFSGCDAFDFALDGTPTVTREADGRVTVSADGRCVVGIGTPRTCHGPLCVRARWAPGAGFEGFNADGSYDAGVVDGGFAVVDEVLVCHPSAMAEGGSEAFVLTSNMPMASGAQLEITLDVSTPSNRPCEACRGGGIGGLTSP